MNVESVASHMTLPRETLKEKPHLTAFAVLAEDWLAPSAEFGKTNYCCYSILVCLTANQTI